MSLIGALLAGVAASALVLALRARTPVGRYLDRIAPAAARTATLPAGTGSDRTAETDPRRIALLRVGTMLAGISLASAATLVVPTGPAVVLLCGYAGWIAPSILLARRAAHARDAADRATVALVERAEALVAAGRPAETALALLIARPTGSPLLDVTLRQVDEAYQLGAPLFRTLALHARREGLLTCAAVAESLERSRDLGAGSLAVLRERRTALRAAERARSLETASQVEGRMMLVLVLCYLPALMLLVVVPLFLGLLDALAA